MEWNIFCIISCDRSSIENKFINRHKYENNKEEENKRISITLCQEKTQYYKLPVFHNDYLRIFCDGAEVVNGVTNFKKCKGYLSTIY